MSCADWKDRLLWNVRPLLDRGEINSVSCALMVGKRKRPEQDLQMAVMRYLKICAPQAECFHFPNGNYRRKVEASIIKGMGAVAGTPDICILWKPSKVGFIELKPPGETRVSATQRAFHLRLWELGVPNAICRSIYDVRSQLTTWGVPMRNATIFKRDG